MNKETARQEAIEWCVRRVREVLDDGKIPTPTVTEKEGLFLSQIYIWPVVEDSKQFPFREIKAPPKGTLIRVWDTFEGCSYKLNETRIRVSSGHLAYEGLKICDTENVYWDRWEVVRIEKVDSKYNNTGDTENE